MNPEEILSLLEGIGVMLSPTAQKVWVIALRNAALQGYINLAWAIVTFLGALTSIGVGCYGLALRRKWRKCLERDWDAKSSADSFMISGFCATVVFVIAFVPLITAAVSYLSVPEYRAIQNLMRMLQGSTP